MALREELWPRDRQPQGAVETTPASARALLLNAGSGRLDLSPNRCAVTANGTVALTANRAGVAFNFTGSGSNYLAVSGVQRKFTSDDLVTMVAVVEITAAGSYPMFVSGYAGSDSAAAGGLELRGAAGTGRLEFSGYVTGVGYFSVQTAVSIVNTGPRRIVARYTPSGVKLWVDGVLSGAQSFTAGAVTWGTHDWKIGGRAGTTAYSLTGSVALLDISGEALGDAACQDLSSNPWALFEPLRVGVPASAGGGSLDLTQTTGVSLAGTVATSGDIQIGTNFNLTQSSAVGLTGSLATIGDVQIGTTFNLAQTAAVGLAGSVGVSGDFQILSGSLDLTQTSAVAMSGTVGLSGDIQIGTSFDLAPTAAVGLTGSVATTGNIQVGTNFDLSQSVALAMSGSVAVSGDFQSGTAPVVTQAYGNFGWDPRIRPSWKRKELREELEAALDDAPKAVQELVRVPGPDISEVPVREALEVVRKSRRYTNQVAVTRQEIDELHEALETVATFTREREAARQARRRKQQHLLLLS